MKTKPQQRNDGNLTPFQGFQSFRRSGNAQNGYLNSNAHNVKKIEMKKV